MTAGGRIEAFFANPAGSIVTVTNTGGTDTAVGLTAGDYTPTSFCAHLEARLNAAAAPSSGAWTVTLSTGPNGTGLVTINCEGSWSMTFTTEAAGTVLGFEGNISSTSSPVTGTQNARGLWLPRCHLVIAGDPARAPEETDARSTESPTGAGVTLVGTCKYRHRGLAWRHVTRARTWEGEASPAYSSWQAWLRDTQWGRGHAWFTPGSPFHVYYDLGGTDAIVGADLNSGAGPTEGWQASPAIDRCAPRTASGQWLGLWTIEIPAIVAGD